MYNLNHAQCVSAILAGGAKRSVLVQGDMGGGKTALLSMLSEKLPSHTPVYFDATNKDLGDIAVPNLREAEGKDYVTFSPNEEFGIHIGGPIILMIDEYGKANPMVKQGLTRCLLERMVGTRSLPEGSIVFATTNLGAEGVGDLLQGHQRNRLTIVTLQKSNNLEWIEWGINNEVHPTILSWAKDTPQLFHSFTEVNTPADNPYIYHPREQREAFVTPRSLESASDWIKVRDTLDDTTLTGLLCGTIGARGAMDLMAYIKLADQLPSMDSIKSNPLTAKVPDSAAAICMVVYRTLASIEKPWVNAWLEYMARLDKEAQGMFVNGVRQKGYKRQREVMTNKKFTEWAMRNSYLYTADKV